MATKKIKIEEKVVESVETQKKEISNEEIKEEKVEEKIVEPIETDTEIKEEKVEVENRLFSKENLEYKKLLEKNGMSERHALFEYCFLHNICYNIKTYYTLARVYVDELNDKMPEIYINTIKEDEKLKDVTFFSQIRIDNFEKIYAEDYEISNLSEDDKKNRQIVIDIFSYDPFKEEAPEDKPQLYRDLAGMSSDVMRKDVAKQKAAISVVRSYGNIEKYQRKVNDIMKDGNVDEASQKLLDSYMKIISNIQSSVNQTAEKNNFTVKGIGGSGHGTLSDVLTQIGEKGIDEGVTNFYDIATSKSIEEIANISFKAQLNQVNLSKTDYADILSEQCKIVRDAQRKAKDAMEAARLAKEKIVKQDLLDELAYDYKKKGISESEIEEFISREYKLYDDID